MSYLVHYFSFVPDRADALWKDFLHDFHKAKDGQVFDMYYQPFEGLLMDEEPLDEERMLMNLKFLDLNYGSVYCEPVEGGKLENVMVSAIADACGFQPKFEILSKEDLVTLYSTINVNVIKRAIDAVERTLGRGKEEAE